MKNLKKINVGLVLTIIIVLAVVIYSIVIENQRKSSKEEIKKSCVEYVDLIDKYLVLPESAQVLGEDVKNVNLDGYKSELENELKSVMVNDSAVMIQKAIVSDFAEKDLLNTSTFITSYDKKINKVKSYSFDGNQVTVVLESMIKIKHKYSDVNMETGEQQERIKEDSYDKVTDTITLEKKDGKWKVVYSNLDFGGSEYRNAM